MIAMRTDIAKQYIVCLMTYPIKHRARCPVKSHVGIGWARCS